MYNVEKLQSIAEKVRYKPGWTIEVSEFPPEWPYDPQMLKIEVEVPDAYHPGETVPLRIWSAIPPQHSTKQFLDFLLWRLARIEVHEAREFFRYNHEIWSDPHKDG